MKKVLGPALVALWAFVIVIALGQLFLARASAEEMVWVQMPLCQNEDGNLDGSTCMWIDPDTGRGYVSLSEAYWDEF